MVKKIIKVLLYAFGGVMIIIFGLLSILWLKSPGITDPITDSNGQEIPGSISGIEEITLGGEKQYLIIRGADKSKPVMLFLHGGPGSPELPFMKEFNQEIEKGFVMVYWEQRGSGKSYSGTTPVESMKLEQFISDTRELTEYLCTRFEKEKIYLIGHSWGTLLGILTAYQHPELFYAYLGVGQLADQYKGELVSFEWVKEQAKLRNDEKAFEFLSQMKFPDAGADSEEWLNFLMHERKYVTEYGGAMRGITSMWPMVKILINSKEYTLSEKFNYMKGSLFSLESLWPDVMSANLFNQIDSMQVPVYIFQGIYDYQTPYSVAKEFYEQLKAPHKEFFTFENSAHSPMMEEVDKFNSLVRQVTQLQNHINP